MRGTSPESSDPPDGSSGSLDGPSGSLGADSLDEALYKFLAERGDADRAVTGRITVRERTDHHSGQPRRVRRYILDGDREPPVVYAKACGDAQTAAREFAVLRELAAAGAQTAIAVAPPLACTGDVLLTAGLDGRALADARGGGSLRAALGDRFADLGAWLAGFHANHGLPQRLPPATGQASLGAEAEAALAGYLDEWGGRYIGPGLRVAITSAVRNVASSGLLKSATGPAHGDFAPDQLVIASDGATVGMVDFEDAHIGYQAWDVARFCAKLRLLQAVSLHPGHGRLLAALERQFVDGYAAVSPLDRRTLACLRLVDLIRVRSPLALSANAGLRTRALMWLRRRRYRALLRTALAETSALDTGGAA